jgi:phosphotriesterase-related protein
MLSELNGTIEETGVQAAWIKLSAGDDAITDCETKILRAAARAGKETGSIIGSHTIKGRVVRDQLDIIEAAGYTASRFIWIHTQADADFSLHLEMAKRGAWLEYDGIGNNATSDETYIENIKRLLDAGYEKQLMLSHDRGWYDAGNPTYVPKPFTYISETFIPKLREAGLGDEIIVQLTQTNPFSAFAR